MELTNFESGAVKYGSMSMDIGKCNKKNNNISLYFNDIYRTKAVGIGVHCKADITNYDKVEIKVNNIEYTGFANAFYLVGNIYNDYHKDSVSSSYESNTGGVILNGIKNIKIEGIQGEKYISIIIFNPAGDNSNALGSLSMDIETVVLR